MGCHSNNENNSCNTTSCSTGQEQEQDSCSKEAYFLELADEAWEEVLKEQIKAHILATQKERMAELAKIVSEANSQRWRAKIEKKQACMDFAEKLCRFFGSSKK